MYEDTVTVFNRVGNLWKPTVLRNVDLVVDFASLTARYGETNQNSAVLHVKINDGKVAGKEYLEPMAFGAKADASRYITFRSGNNADFFVKGEFTEEANDDEYKNGFFHHVKNHFDNVFVITSVGQYKLLPHFEIFGK